MRKNPIFTERSEFKDEEVAIPWDDYELNDNYYKVDRIRLDSILSRDQRIATAFIPTNNPSDKVIMKSIVRFASINSKHIAGKSVGVQFVEKEGMNYASFEGNAISISLSPFFDHRIPLEVRFNIVAGLIYHELFHCRYTTPGMGMLLQKAGHTTSSLNKMGKRIFVPDFKALDKIIPSILFKDIVNVLEDYRIEKIGLDEFPGYVFFFDDLRKYASWRRKNILLAKEKEKLHTILAEDPLEQDELLFDYLLYKKLLPEMLNDFVTSSNFEPETKKKCKKIDAILDTSTDTTFNTMHKQSKEIYELFSKEYREHHKQRSPFSDLTPIDLPDELLEKLAELLQEVMLELSVEDESLIGKEIKKLKERKPSNNSKAVPYNKIEIEPAPEGEFEQEVYKQANDIARNIQINLAFLDSRFNRTTEVYELRSGELDEDSLYSLKFNNRDLFYDEEEAPGYSLDIAVLVDESGSMGGRKIEEARIATLALALALRNSKHINLLVYGHTADQGYGKDSQVSMFRYLDPFNRASNINTLFSIESRANNADSYAIEHMGEVLKASGARQKVLIVVSDGQPAARCYGYGNDGIEQTAEAVQKLERQNVFVIQIAVGNIEDSAKMFSHFIPYDGTKLGQNLKQILNKKLVQISNLV